MQEDRYTEVARSVVSGRLALLRLLDNERQEIVEVSRDADEEDRYIVSAASENGGFPRTLSLDDVRRFGNHLPADVRATADRYRFGDWLRDRFRRLGG